MKVYKVVLKEIFILQGLIYLDLFNYIKNKCLFENFIIYIKEYQTKIIGEMWHFRTMCEPIYTRYDSGVDFSKV